MDNGTFGYISKIVYGILTAATLAGIGYLIIVVDKSSNLEIKLEKQEEPTHETTTPAPTRKHENTEIIRTSPFVIPACFKRESRKQRVMAGFPIKALGNDIAKYSRIIIQNLYRIIGYEFPYRNYLK